MILKRFQSSHALTRNIGVIAHIDAGKTSVTERLLFNTGMTRRCGSVDNGDTVMDYLPEERERGITITAAAITLPWRQHKINLIDTPGHVDFTVEVERSLRVLEGAVMILDASKGVQAQTLTVWKQAMRYAVSPLIFVNKMDKVGADPFKVLSDVEEKLCRVPIPINWPTLDSHGSWTGELEDHLHTPSALELLAEHDLTLLEAFLENKPAPHDAIIKALGSDKLVPVLFGSAVRNIGVAQLLDAIVDFLPPPKRGVFSSLQALAFKVVFDPRRQQLLVYARIYSGALTKGSTLTNVNKGIVERVTKLMQVMADELVEIEEIPEGSVGIIMGLKHTATGDTLASAPEKTLALPGIKFQAPVCSVSIEAASPGEQAALDRGLELLQLEDPSIQVVANDSGQTILCGQGELHLEVAEGRLASVFGTKFSTGAVQVAMKEGLDAQIYGQDVVVDHFIDREVFGVKIVAGIKVTLSSNTGTWLRFSKSFDDNYKSAMEEGVRSALSTGPIQGYPVDLSTLTVTIKDAQIYPVTTVSACRLATSEAVRLALKQAVGSFKLSEPLACVVIETPAEFVGTITGNLFSARECLELEEQSSESGNIVLQAIVPMRTMLRYTTWLRTQSSGRASFSIEFSHYSMGKRS